MARKNKTSTPAAEAPAVEPVVEKNEVIESAPVEEAEAVPTVSVADEFTQLTAELASLAARQRAVSARLRQLAGRVSREMKLAQRSGRRRKAPSTGEAKPNGFTKPVQISKELATFLGVKHADLMARTEVNRRITEYIKANSLQDKTNGQIIYPDDKLRKLLGVSKDTVVKFFNIQTFLKQHYPKPVVATA
jgi:chromatin remodeling complex protein RSC6